MDRDALIAQFIREAGWADADVGPLAGDASNRRYLRLRRGDTTSVLMDAPPHRGEDVRPFIAVTEWLLAQGFAAPALLAQDAALGFLLLEDLGDNLFARHLHATPGDERALYTAAVHVLARLAQTPAPARIGGMDLKPYDRATLDREAALFIEWYMHHAQGAVSPDMAAEFKALVQDATARVEPARDVVVLRDYHAENLLWRPGQDRTVGLLDYQDALAGHAAYDLMSLLEDARRDTSEDLQQAMINLYLAERPTDREAFLHAYAALGAQRQLKIIGIFARLAIRDGKPGYLALIPRVWNHLQRDLSHPEMAPLAAWVHRHAPEPTARVLDALAARVPA